MSGHIASVAELGERIREDPKSTHGLLRAFVKGNSFPITDNDRATFFFWDGHATHEVFLIHWVFGLESRQAFQRLEGTDAFFLHVELPRAARVEYKLELVRDYQRHLVRDPLNPLLARDPFGANSVCPMPGYREPAWAVEEVGHRAGRLEPFTMRSQAWDGDRDVTVYLPYEYAPHKRYPLLICHDGADYLRFANAATVLDNLILRHEVKPLVVAFVNAGPSRNQEYAANPRQADFVAVELVAEMHERYGLLEGREHHGLMGASFGAVSSLHAAWTHPQVFGKLLLQSGSFAFTDIGHHDRGELWDPVVRFVNALRHDPARLDARVFLSCGAFESLIYYNRSLAPLMRKAGLQVRFVESLDGHNWICWRDRLRVGLAGLFPGHLRMFYE